jgi:hypothetical protein
VRPLAPVLTVLFATVAVSGCGPHHSGTGLECGKGFEALTNLARTESDGVDMIDGEAPLHGYFVRDSRGFFVVTDVGHPAHPAVILRHGDGTVAGCGYGASQPFDVLVAEVESPTIRD